MSLCIVLVVVGKAVGMPVMGASAKELVEGDGGAAVSPDSVELDAGLGGALGFTFLLLVAILCLFAVGTISVIACRLGRAPRGCRPRSVLVESLSLLLCRCVQQRRLRIILAGLDNPPTEPTQEPSLREPGAPEVQGQAAFEGPLVETPTTARDFSTSPPSISPVALSCDPTAFSSSYDPSPASVSTLPMPPTNSTSSTNMDSTSFSTFPDISPGSSPLSRSLRDGRVVGAFPRAPSTPSLASLATPDSDLSSVIPSFTPSASASSRSLPADDPPKDDGYYRYCSIM